MAKSVFEFNTKTKKTKKKKTENNYDKALHKSMKNAVYCIVK